MFSLDDFESETIIPEKIKERIKNLDEDKQAEFVKVLSEEIVNEYHKLSEKEQLNLNTIDNLIVNSIEQVLDKIDNQPVDNWKNGLDLL